MRLDRLTEAELEAKRFLGKVKELRNRIEREKGNGYSILGSDNMIEGCKETAAVKRSSMDTTRALATLRKSDYDN